jgi:integrase
MAMAKQVKRLTAKDVESLVRDKTVGMHADGGGLFLKISRNGGASWLLRYSIGGKVRETGLGGVRLVKLPEARKKAEAIRANRTDPVAAREAEKAKVAAERTFEAAAGEYIAAHAPGWRSPVHRQQWANTLRDYATFGSKPVADITTDDVLTALRPIWAEKPETANRVRSRIKIVLDFARARGWRSGDNPAVWSGHLEHALPSRAELAGGRGELAARAKVNHHPALAWQDVPALVAKLKASGALSAVAVLFLIYTAGRSAEIRGVRWDEIASDGQTWTIPADRMKGGAAHRVPLSAQTQALLDQVKPLARGGLVFPGFAKGEPKQLSDVALSKMIPPGTTIHGLRTSFRTWVAEACPDVPGDVAEMCLAHVVGTKVQRSYQRSDLIDQRRALMQRWSNYVNGCASEQASGDMDMHADAQPRNQLHDDKQVA